MRQPQPTFQVGFATALGSRSWFDWSWFLQRRIEKDLYHLGVRETGEDEGLVFTRKLFGKVPFQFPVMRYGDLSLPFGLIDGCLFALIPYLRGREIGVDEFGVVHPFRFQQGAIRLAAAIKLSAIDEKRQIPTDPGDLLLIRSRVRAEVSLPCRLGVRAFLLLAIVSLVHGYRFVLPCLGKPLFEIRRPSGGPWSGRR